MQHQMKIYTHAAVLNVLPFPSQPTTLPESLVPPWYNFKRYIY